MKRFWPGADFCKSWAAGRYFPSDSVAPVRYCKHVDTAGHVVWTWLVWGIYVLAAEPALGIDCGNFGRSGKERVHF